MRVRGCGDSRRRPRIIWSISAGSARRRLSIAVPLSLFQVVDEDVVASWCDDVSGGIVVGSVVPALPGNGDVGICDLAKGSVTRILCRSCGVCVVVLENASVESLSGGWEVRLK